jgi:hypothetical protein
MTMRITASLFGIVIATALGACGGGGSNDRAPGLPPAPSPPGTAAPQGAPARTMGTARAMQTSTENLLFDPTFSTLNDSFAFDLSGDGAHGETPATSPAGPATRVLVVKNATKNHYFLMGQGGSGPFDARVFVSTPDGAPATVYFASLTEQTAVYALTAVDGADQKHGSKTYKLYEAKVPDAVYGSIAMVFDVSTTPEITIAAPELTSTTEMTTKSASAPARRVRLGADARRALDAIAHRPVFPGRRERIQGIRRAAPALRGPL